MLANVEECGAHQIADVLNEEPRSWLRVQRLDGRLNHGSVEMASGSGVHLNGAGTGAPNALRVERRFLVALDGAHGIGVTELGNGALEQGGLTRAGRAHQIKCCDPSLGKPLAVVLSEVIVLGEDRLADDQILGARG